MVKPMVPAERWDPEQTARFAASWHRELRRRGLMAEATQLTDGSPVPADRSHTVIDPATGMQRGYVVLSPEERARGFVKPVRTGYVHAGRRVCGATLRPYESELYGPGAKIICTALPDHAGEHGGEGLESVATRVEVTRVNHVRRYKGCGGATVMKRDLAETYARDPRFYSGTFCATCRHHFPLGEFEWQDGEPMDPDLQEAWAAGAAERARERAEFAKRLALRTAVEHVAQCLRLEGLTPGERTVVAEALALLAAALGEGA